MDHSGQHQHQHHHQPQPQPQAQDVLAEARKNLQVLIDSGLSRDMLHQLVDENQVQALQLALPSQASLLQSQQQQQQQSQPQQQQHQHIPPQPRCPPPPPPDAAQQQQRRSSQQQQPPVLSPIATTTPTSSTPKPAELQGDDVHTGIAMLAYPGGAAAPFGHRPRISVASTSSGSSGHASVFSNISNHSAMSWASAGSNCPRMQAPLPMPPQITSPTGAPIMNANNGSSTSISTASTATGTINKQNIYWCTSCETSFKRKYDWKRHEDEFHERWRKYPCPEPGCNRSFWGSNSFNQHHKQCHGCTTCPHAEKIVKFLRKRKYWACGFCSALHPARERHVEHVARHFESGMTKGEWMHSRVIYGLLHQPLIHEAWEALLNGKQSHHAGRRPRFSWHPSKTGRAQGFLEKESPGQLQDLLEFFSGDEGEAQFIASTAYDLADIVMDNAMQLTPPHFPPQQHQPNTMQSYQDPRMSFASMQTPQQHQHILPADPNGQHGYSQGYNPMFMASQPFPPRTTGPSPPESTSHSPLTSSHSPIAPSHTTAIKQEVQQPQSDAASGLSMDFEYSPAPIVFEDWESMHGQSIDETSPQQPNGPQGWGMMQYFNDPRVAS